MVNLYKDCPKTQFRNYFDGPQYVMDAGSHVVIGGPGTWVVLKPEQARLAANAMLQYAADIESRQEAKSSGEGMGFPTPEDEVHGD